ncbi:uncharacterized protein LOC123547775 [Mercenaria mercenaria]|uniref:uncharacterized protein LOC123547775 n=1 Tax=Mercenaria mercenaria TaxID=6596 RepID=UPI00234F7BD7|nr:uncharacterized protein LOC123547775 [Mercenaria mercenaria]
MYEKIGLCVTGLALILNIVGVAIPYWFYSGSIQGVPGTSIYFGLWKSCVANIQLSISSIMPQSVHGPVISMCNSVDDIEGFLLPSEFKATRALEILAILATAATAVVVCLKMFVRKNDNRLLYAASPIQFIAGLLMIIGAIVFVADNKAKKAIDSGFNTDIKPHAAFGLCIVSGILSFVAAVLYFLAARTIPGLR